MFRRSRTRRSQKGRVNRESVCHGRHISLETMEDRILLSAQGLDPGFGVNGRTETTVSALADYAEGIALQSDGKAVVIGATANGNNLDFSIIRYDTCGNLDTTFGVDGVVTVDFGGGNDTAYDVAIQADGMIVVAGETTAVNGITSRFALSRLDMNGHLDASFAASGKLVADLPGSFSRANGVAIGADEAIIVGGYSGERFTNGTFAIARFDSSGEFDTSFGNTGFVLTDFGPGNDYVQGLALQDDGRIVVAGFTGGGVGLQFAVARYEANGNLDSTFGNIGKQVVDFGPSDDAAFDVVVRSNGAIVVSGYSFNGSTGYDFSLAQFLPDGSLDSGFGSGGKVVTAVTSGEDIGMSVGLQSDGAVIVAGDGPNDRFSMARYDIFGRLDTSFGNQGIVLADRDDRVNDLIVQDDDKILLAGSAVQNASSDTLLMRFKPDASPRVSGETLSFDEVAALMHQQHVTGATIITHGYQFSDAGGDSLISLAQAIRDRADTENGTSEKAWLLNYDVVGLPAEGLFELDGLPTVSGQTGEVVLLFDWARESNEPSAGWGEAAGDALFSMIVGLGLADPFTGTSVPLHFIGHSFGTAVTSEAVERLARFSVPVAQVTYLDPHEFDQGVLPVDGSQHLFDLGRPDGYGATVWDNVAFTDVYYQTEFAPSGRPIPGAYNVLVNNQVDGYNAHTDVWNIFYKTTVSDASSTTGYAFSSIARHASGGYPPLTDVANESFRFLQPGSEASQDHSNTTFPLKDHGRNLSSDEINYTKWAPEWDPTSIVNGDFSDLGNISLSLVPGWSDHGGGGGGHVDGAFLELDSLNAERTHNRFYIPANAGYLQFDLRRTTSSSNDRLEVELGDETWIFSLSTTDSSAIPKSLEIPLRLRNTVQELAFRIVADGLLNVIDSEVRIDNVKMSDVSATVSVARISDGAEPSTNGKFRVTQSAVSYSDTVVHYSVTGTATPGAGNDYTTLTGTATIVAGATTADIDVAVLDDAIAEATETVIVTLTGFGAHDPGITLLVNGDLDPSFGSGGIVTTQFPSATSQATSVLVQPDGKIVATGISIGASGYRIALARYNTDGTLDLSFGTSGRVTTHFSGSGARGLAAALQVDGKIVVVGQVIIGSETVFGAARYNGDGSLDFTFGSGGLVTTAFPGTNNDLANGVAIQSDGKIVVGGSLTNGFPTADFGLMRYNSDGSLDPTFGSGGIVRTDFGAHDGSNTLLLQRDGKILVGGITSTGSPIFGLARYNTDGSLDNTFSGDGFVSTRFSGANSQSIFGLAEQPDGKIIATGQVAYSYFGQSDVALARYNTDGSLDTAFNSVGYTNTDVAGDLDQGKSVAVLTDGRILVAGYATNSNTGKDLLLLRYRSDGTLDTSFGINGFARTAITSADDVARSMVVQNDGRVVLAGFAGGADEDTATIAVVRYAPSATLSIADNDFDLIVTTADDELDVVITANDLSLREAMFLANQRSGANVITFDTAGEFSTPRTIALSLGELSFSDVSGTTTISGPGADQLAVSGNNVSRVFHVLPNRSATIDGVTIRDGRVNGFETFAGGGGLRVEGTLDLANSKVISNYVARDGAGILVLFGQLTVTNTAISDNTAGNGAGGLFNEGGLVTLRGSTVSDNVGGGIFHAATAQAMIVDSSTVSGNGQWGIVSDRRSNLLISNSTISNNTGGGVINASGQVTVRNCTIASNQDPNFSGGIANLGGGTSIISNTIVSGNQTAGSPRDVNGSFASAGYNLIGIVGDATGVTNGVNGDQVGTLANPIDPRLGPLTNNGGPTLTRALLAGSPANNSGNPDFVPPPDTDQRGTGFARVLGGRLDIGAFELANDAPTAIALSNTTIAENQPIGTIVGAFSTVDPDAGDTFTYSLVAGTGDAQNAGFTIDAIGNLRAAAIFDFETRSSYSIRARSVDQGGLATESVFTISVTNVTELNGIDVQKGQTQRSFVRYLDILFDQGGTDLFNLISSNRLQMTRYDLNGENGMVSAFPTPTVSGRQIQLDFGVQGIGGNRNTNVGDGYYELGIDMDGNGSFESKKYFHRLLGDVNGDGIVSAADKSQVLVAQGTTSVEADVNGDGFVNVADTTLVTRAVGRKLKGGLFRDD